MGKRTVCGLKAINGKEEEVFNGFKNDDPLRIRHERERFTENFKQKP
jgi:hypothetical protein